MNVWVEHIHSSRSPLKYLKFADCVHCFKRLVDIFIICIFHSRPNPTLNDNNWVVILSTTGFVFRLFSKNLNLFLIPERTGLVCSPVSFFGVLSVIITSRP